MPYRTQGGGGKFFLINYFFSLIVCINVLFFFLLLMFSLYLFFFFLNVFVGGVKIYKYVPLLSCNLLFLLLNKKKDKKVSKQPLMCQSLRPEQLFTDQKRVPAVTWKQKC